VTRLFAVLQSPEQTGSDVMRLLYIQGVGFMRKILY